MRTPIVNVVMSGLESRMSPRSARGGVRVAARRLTAAGEAL